MLKLTSPIMLLCQFKCPATPNIPFSVIFQKSLKKKKKLHMSSFRLTNGIAWYCFQINFLQWFVSRLRNPHLCALKWAKNTIFQWWPGKITQYKSYFFAYVDCDVSPCPFSSIWQNGLKNNISVIKDDKFPKMFVMENMIYQMW